MNGGKSKMRVHAGQAMAWLATAGCGLICAVAQAAHPLVTDDTGTQGDGRWQLEANADRSRTRHDGGTDRATQANVTLTRGVGDALDVGANVPALRWRSADGESASGVGDVALQAKWRFWGSADEGGSLALKPLVLLPTGSERRGLGTGRAGASLALLGAWKTGDWMMLANAGVTYNGNRAGDRTALWNVSAAVLYTPVPVLTLALDAGVSRNPDRASSGTLRYGLLGAIWHVHDDVDLDIGWRRNRGGGQRTDTWGLGVTVRW